MIVTVATTPFEGQKPGTDPSLHHFDLRSPDLRYHDLLTRT